MVVWSGCFQVDPPKNDRRISPHHTWWVLLQHSIQRFQGFFLLFTRSAHTIQNGVHAVLLLLLQQPRTGYTVCGGGCGAGAANHILTWNQPQMMPGEEQRLSPRSSLFSFFPSFLLLKKYKQNNTQFSINEFLLSFSKRLLDFCL